MTQEKKYYQKIIQVSLNNQPLISQHSISDKNLLVISEKEKSGEDKYTESVSKNFLFVNYCCNGGHDECENSGSHIKPSVAN